jgi:capsule polysaccharide export protein KpsE/RkpR
MNHNQSKNNDQTLEITLVDLITFIKKYFLSLIFAALVSGVIGIVYSFTLPRKYTAQTILLPEYTMGGGNSFFSMAVGSDKGGAEKLTPDLYPNILNSAPFGKHLLTIPVTDKNNVQYKTLKAYLLRDSTVSFFKRFFSSPKEAATPKKIVNSPQLSNIMILSGEESGLVRAASSLVFAKVDTKNGIITLESELTDPFVAAILVEASKDYLIKYVEEYRTSKTGEQVTFLEKRMTEAKRRQQHAEYALQSYRDHNRNAYLNVARIEEQRLQAEYTLSQSIYSDLTIKLEQAKIKVKEEKPVFKVLEPSRVPLDKSSPNRPIVAVVFALLGGLFTLIYIVFFKEKLHLKLL